MKILIRGSVPTDGHEFCIRRTSFWIKLVFVIVQIALAIAFIVAMSIGAYDTAAAFEWTLAFVFRVFSG
jgi:flagellar basal body-associated protein FliL